MRIVIYGLIGLALMLLTVSLAIYDLWTVAIAVAVVGIFWMIGIWRGIPWAASWGLLTFGFAAAYGLLNHVSLNLILPAIIATLAAWDLDGFQTSIAGIEVRQQTALMWRHLIRLAEVIVIGLVLGWIVLNIETSLRPIWGILLGLFIMIGLGRTIRYLRQESD